MFLSGVFIDNKYFFLGLVNGEKPDDRQFDPRNRFLVCILPKDLCVLLVSVYLPFSTLNSFLVVSFFACLLQVVILTMFTLITLLSTIIPISLYVSIEVTSLAQNVLSISISLVE